MAECDDGDQIGRGGRAGIDPDVVLMDVRMRRMDGVTATRLLRRTDGDGPAVLILTTFDDDDVLWGALDAGAAGFVLKDASAEDLIAATPSGRPRRGMARPEGGAEVLQRVPHERPSAGWPKPLRVDGLTEREHDVLRHMARGATNIEIATALFVSEATVKSHVGSIFSKLGARDRAAAIVFAYDHGIVGPRPGTDVR